MKKIRWFISLIAIAALILSACGNNNDQKEKQTQDQEKNALQEIKD
jgi:cystine transport system substrate-binding protein